MGEGGGCGTLLKITLIFAFIDRQSSVVFGKAGEVTCHTVWRTRELHRMRFSTTTVDTYLEFF